MAPEALALASSYPMLRYMGSKARLVPWIHEELSRLDFTTALDAFSGSGVVAYLMKAMGKSVTATDFLLFPSIIAEATIANSYERLVQPDTELLLGPAPAGRSFIGETFEGIFYTPEDLAFLDNTWANLGELSSPYKRSIALAAMFRACVKRQPRGVFSFGDPSRYQDGRRDLALSLRDHFIEQVERYNEVVLDNGQVCRAERMDALEGSLPVFDLVYLDPPYVPRSDDNCYVKRYHFLEGLASYWQADDAQPEASSLVRKLPKRFTPFSYRRTALDAFDRLFERFSDSTLVLSYSSNGYPDLAVLVELMSRYKRSVTVAERNYHYRFGTHSNVSAARTRVREYLVVGVR
jgi:adenine-specific DNA-methyltransferase